jgi:hypothetical protein
MDLKPVAFSIFDKYLEPPEELLDKDVSEEVLRHAIAYGFLKRNELVIRQAKAQVEAQLRVRRSDEFFRKHVWNVWLNRLKERYEQKIEGEVSSIDGEAVDDVSGVA